MSKPAKRSAATPPHGDALRGERAEPPQSLPWPAEDETADERLAHGRRNRESVDDLDNGRRTRSMPEEPELDPILEPDD